MNNTFKVSIVGKTTVGKSTIVRRLQYDAFYDKIECTVGVSFAKIIYEGNTYELWDTAGQERYNSLLPMYFRNTKIILFVFDVTDPKTFDNIYYYHKTLETCNNTDNYKIIILGNKIDSIKEDELEIIKKDIKNKIDNCSFVGFIYDTIYISAKSGVNMGVVKDSFKNCSQLININKKDNAFKIEQINNYKFEQKQDSKCYC